MSQLDRRGTAGSPGPGVSPQASLEGTESATADGPLPPLDPEASPYFRELRDLLDQGSYDEAVRRAYRLAFDGTVRAYGLAIPPSCSDRRFVKEALRPDMGPLVELSPELYRLYEPVRFGTTRTGDRDHLLALLRRLFSETVLGRIHDPAFQPKRNATEPKRPSVRYDQMFHSLTSRGARSG